MMNSDFPLQIIQAIRSVIGTERVSLHEPNFSGNESAYVLECINTGWVSSVGKFVDRFEQQLAEFTGVKHAIAVVNGTAALQICLKLAEVEAGDEVLVPTLTFVATANAVTYCGAIPHFIDSEYSSLGMDAKKLDDYLHDITEIRANECFNKITGRRIKAALPMHTFGHPVDLDTLTAVCQKYHLELIEDIAESLGSYYKGKHTGHWGKLSALSFNGNKIITTGGGGAILTNDEKLGKLAKHLTTTAKVPHRWAFVHDHIGFNYRLPNLNAALGCAQLEQLPVFIQRKKALVNQYIKAFSTLQGASFFQAPYYANSNYWLNTLILDKEYSSQLETVLDATNENGVMTRPAWNLMHQLDIYKDSPKMPNLEVAEDLVKRIINIPSSVSLGAMHE
jgi:perosamine synthetase